METLRGYRFELDPNDRQRTQLTRAAGLARFVWNWGLAARQDHYEQVVKPARERGEKVSGLSRFDQINAWNAVKDEVAPWVREHSSRIAEYALDDLEAACRGVTIVVADRSHPSSQLCSGCGAQNRALSLKDRTFSCPACGLLIDRDRNAALNLRPVAVMPTEALNARRGGVSPGSETTWQH
jgi:transposase